jgi:phage baseplate assembly protein W
MADTALGITLPIKRGKTGFFEQGFDALTQVKSNLINLILTRKGERVYQPTFGSDLHSLVFAQMDQEYEQKVKQAVVSAVRTWMPFLRIQEQTVTRDDDRNSTLLEVTFGLRSNADITETIVVEF